MQSNYQSSIEAVRVKVGKHSGRFAWASLSGKKCFATVTAFTLLALSLNLHLFFMQVLGWGGMIIENQRETASWVEAVDITFGGEKPCSLCTTVASALRPADGVQYPAVPRALEDTRLLSGMLLFWVRNDLAVLPPAHTAVPAIMTGDNVPGGYIAAPEPPPPKLV